MQAYRNYRMPRKVLSVFKSSISWKRNKKQFSLGKKRHRRAQLARIWNASTWKERHMCSKQVDETANGKEREKCKNITPMPELPPHQSKQRSQEALWTAAAAWDCKEFRGHGVREACSPRCTAHYQHTGILSLRTLFQHGPDGLWHCAMSLPSRLRLQSPSPPALKFLIPLLPLTPSLPPTITATFRRKPSEKPP